MGHVFFLFAIVLLTLAACGDPTDQPTPAKNGSGMKWLPWALVDS